MIALSENRKKLSILRMLSPFLYTVIIISLCQGTINYGTVFAYDINEIEAAEVLCQNTLKQSRLSGGSNDK